MAVVVLLRGVNVGGHRRFRPAEVARALRPLDCVSIGAAGTFVSVLAGRPRLTPPLPLDLPPGREWLVRLTAREGRFLIGCYRRDMKAIGCLGSIDRLFGVPVTTRNWNTMAAIVEAIGAGRRS